MAPRENLHIIDDVLIITGDASLNLAALTLVGGIASLSVGLLVAAVLALKCISPATRAEA